MNKTLFDKVKNLCKDYGLSEKYLQEVTEILGGHIADDSTDTEEIEKVANMVASLGKPGQAEATRWAAKKGKKSVQKNRSEDDDDPMEARIKALEDDDDPMEARIKALKDDDDPMEARIKALEDELAKSKAEKSKLARASEIEKAMEKHKIPQYLRTRFAKSIDDEEDIEEAVKSYKQELITNGLDKADAGGSKAVSDKDIDDASEDLLKSISTKQN